MTQVPSPSGASSPGQIRTADLLGALSLAADLAVGLPEEHAVRSCYVGMHLADKLHLTPRERVNLFYAELLMDVGCTAWTSQMAAAILGDEIAARRDFYFYLDKRNPLDVLGWLRAYIAPGAPAPKRVKRAIDFARHQREFVREAFHNTCEVAGRFAHRLGMPREVEENLLSVFEQWDGSGPYGLRGERIPLTSRIVYATSFLEVFHQLGGRAAAIRLARRKTGTAFDPTVVDAFQSLSESDEFWAGLEQGPIWSSVLAMEPESPHRFVREEQLDEIGLAFADFADLKSPYLVGHSRRVADLAERVAHRMLQGPAEVADVRRAALMHDIGLVTVPSFILDRPRAKLTPVEWERLRLHPYHSERILARVPGLTPLARLVASHHERIDGQGYYRGLVGAQISSGARILAVVDEFDELGHDTPDRPACDPGEALRRMRADVGRGLCPDTFQCLTQILREDGIAQPIGDKAPPRQWPAGLTAREVEILRLLARGVSRRQMADQLVLSEHTVRHHLEHIYDKIGVSTRVAATLFAVEHDLLR